MVPQINTASLSKGFRNGVVAAYYSYMIDVAILLGADSSRAVLELKDAVAFEMQLAQVINLTFLNKRTQFCKLFLIFYE